MVKRLVVFDFDGTLINSPLPENGKVMWSNYYKRDYPYIGWFSKKESLDLNVFDIKPLESTYNEYLKEKNCQDTIIIVMSNRLERLRNEIRLVLNKNNITVNEIDLNRDNDNKGQRLFRYIKKFPTISEIVVFDDRDSDLESYENVMPILAEKNINIIINKVFNSENNKYNLINEEINNFICIYNKIKNE